MQFLSHIHWKILHLTEYVYTTSGCDGCDKYEVCFWPIELAPILTRHKRPWKKIVFFRLTYFEILFEILLFLVGAVFVGSATTKIGVFLSQKGPNGFVCLLFVSPCNTVFHKSEYLDENFLWRAGGVYTRSELSVGEYASISRHCRPPINDPWKITPD